METKDLGKTTVGMQANVAACLCYVFGFISGLIFYLIEKENKFVRFHAMQSLVLFGAFFVLNMINAMMLGFLPYSVRAIISMAIGLVGLVLWIVLMVKAYQGEMIKLPIVGDIAEKNS